MKTLLRDLFRVGIGVSAAGLVLCAALPGPARAADPEPPKKTDTPKKPEAKPAAPRGVLDRDHLLGPGDTIDIVVDGYPQFSRTVKLFLDGSFDYPILDTVPARGITIAELKDRVTEGFRKELRRPMVYVSLVDIYIPPPPPPEAIKYFIALGPISRQGEIPIPVPKPFRQVLQELGPSESADLKNIRIKYPDGPPKYIDASTFAREGVIKDDILIKGGEEIILVVKPTVPPAPKLNIQIVGHVVRAGSSFTLDLPMPILDVIEKAGGPKPGAAMDRVKVINDGKERLVNIDKYRGGDIDANYYVKDGDVIHVVEKAMKVLVFGEVQRAGESAVDDGEMLSHAVMQAGISSTGTRGDVELIRQDQAGKVTRTNIALADIQRQKKPDVPLKDGDVLFVKPKNKKKGILGYLSAIASPLWLLRSIAPGGALF